ncbi:MAG: sporulation transcription factor Spo0A [Ruminococcaceae bacterium]|nr:sporulation transcription factor Spo0A [Oscillospiraceae bacterium]
MRGIFTMKKEELRILFSEQSTEMIQNLRHFFEEKGIGVYFCAKDGKAILKAVEDIKPTVVVVDIFLANIDAIAVKKECEKLAYAPKLYFAAGTTDSEKITGQLMGAGFDYYFIKPYSAEYLLYRTEELLQTSYSEPVYDLEYEVSEILHTMGVPAHIKGYSLLRQAIIMVIKEPEVITLVTKRLYPELAKANHTTASRVERAIRHAIEVAWDRGNVEVMNDYFGYTISNMRGKPTNSEFIAMISDRMRLSLKKKKII